MPNCVQEFYRHFSAPSPDYLTGSNRSQDRLADQVRASNVLWKYNTGNDPKMNHSID